jgi:hypothetical protein
MNISILMTMAAVAFVRVPDGGLQPQSALDRQGEVHLIFFKGKPGGGDIFYAHGRGETFSKPRLVNSTPSSAIAIGTIRGAQLALGRNDRVHVIWNGNASRPKHLGAPLYYTRLAEDGQSFEPDRDLIEQAGGLDGGSGIACDDQGHVVVTWHAPSPGATDEGGRTVYVRQSSDDGEHFTPERAVADPANGVCGCCGLRSTAFGTNQTAILYRQARNQVERGMLLLTVDGTQTKTTLVQPWKSAICPMSSCFLARTQDGLLASWETEGQVYWSALSRNNEIGKLISPPGKPGGRKHSVIARNQKGETLLVWTEGTGWNRGGLLAWQLFDSHNQPTSENGRKDGVPVWGSATAWTTSTGDFTVMY